jgi:hypothetical protein
MALVGLNPLVSSFPLDVITIIYLIVWEVFLNEHFN